MENTIVVEKDQSFIRLLFPFKLKDESKSSWLYKYAINDLLNSVRDNIVSTTISDLPFKDFLKKPEKHEEFCIWQEFCFSEREYILPHIESFFNCDCQNSSSEKNDAYLASFKISNDVCNNFFGRDHCFLKKLNKDNWVRYTVKPISDVELYFFRSGVGVFVLDIIPNTIQRFNENPIDEIEGQKKTYILKKSDRYNKYEINDLLELNRYLKNFRKNGGPELYIKVRSEKKEGIKDPKKAWFDIYQKLSLRDFCYNLITASLESKVTSDTTIRWERFYKSRVLTYVYALISKQNQDNQVVKKPIEYKDINKYIYWLRHSYNKSYYPTKADLDSDNNVGIQCTFKNVIFGLSPEGSSTLAWEEDADKKSFITEGLRDRIENPYFLLYLLTLHQKLGSIYFAEQIGEMSYGSEKIRKSKYLKLKLKRLRENIFEFIVRCWFAEVSNNNLYSKIYQSWQKILKTNDLLEEVESEARELDEYINRLEESRRSRLESTITWFFFPAVLFTSIFGMNFIEISNMSFVDNFNRLAFITFGGAIAYYVLVILMRWLMQNFE